MSQFINQHFLVEPLESVNFGPPRSLSAGEAHFIRSQFPPSPLTFQGMVRTQLLRGANPALDLESGESRSVIEQLVGYSSELPSEWQLHGPFPTLWEKLDDKLSNLNEPFAETLIARPWIPTPRYLLHAGASTEHAREIQSPHPGLSDLGQDTPLFGLPEYGEAKPRGGWIGPTNLRYAFAGSARHCWDQNQWAKQMPPFVKSEFQPGLAIDHSSSSAQHGMLYFSQALRFKRGSGLLGCLQASLDHRLDARCLTSGVGQAGRKGRLVEFRPVEKLDPNWEYIIQGKHLPELVKDDERFWLVMLTPVRISNPRDPSLRTSFQDIQVEFIAALTGRAFSIGGFQIVGGSPRPNCLYLPAGSAWLIQLRGGNLESRASALRALHNNHPLGPANEAAMGFGHTLIGLVPTQTTESQP
jgi:CRISPR-associated protein Cmr3